MNCRFTEAAVEAIQEAVRKSEADLSRPDLMASVLGRLEWLGFTLATREDCGLSHYNLAIRFNAIASAATKLLKAVGVEPEAAGDIAPQIGNTLRGIIEDRGERDGHEVLVKHLQGVAELRDVALIAKQKSRSRVSKRGDCSTRLVEMSPWPEPDPVRSAVGDILGIWTSVLNQPITMTYADYWDCEGNVDGPVVDFVGACLAALASDLGYEIQLSRNAIRQVIRRLLPQGETSVGRKPRD
jgi:hypothetical protein